MYTFAMEYVTLICRLFGRIEKETQFGALYTDFMMTKAGALHRANDGYLVLPAEGVLREFFSWDGLKRALRSRELSVEELGERLGFLATKSLQPQPIPLDVKAGNKTLRVVKLSVHARICGADFRNGLPIVDGKRPRGAAVINDEAMNGGLSLGDIKT